MSTQTKSKLFLLIIVILLISNITMLFFLLRKNKGGNRKPYIFEREALMKEFLKTDLHFSTAQLQQYDSLAKQHLDSMKTHYAKTGMRGRTQPEIEKELAAKGFTDSAIIIAVEKKSRFLMERDIQYYKNVAEIRKLCTPEQLIKFDTSFYKIWQKGKMPDKKKK